MDFRILGALHYQIDRNQSNDAETLWFLKFRISLGRYDPEAHSASSCQISWRLVNDNCRHLVLGLSTKECHVIVETTQVVAASQGLACVVVPDVVIYSKFPQNPLNFLEPSNTLSLSFCNILSYGKKAAIIYRCQPNFARP